MILPCIFSYGTKGISNGANWHIANVKNSIEATICRKQILNINDDILDDNNTIK